MSPPPFHDAPVTLPPPPDGGAGFAAGLNEPFAGSNTKSRGVAFLIRAGVQYATTFAWWAAFASGCAALATPGSSDSRRNGAMTSASLRERTVRPLVAGDEEWTRRSGDWDARRRRDGPLA